MGTRASFPALLSIVVVGLVVAVSAAAQNQKAPASNRPLTELVTPAAPPAAQKPAAPPPAPPAAAAEPRAPAPPLRPGEVLLNFQAADIQAVIKTVSQMTGRNFLVDPRVKGQITIISAKPVSAAAAYEVFISALKAQGFATVEGPAGLVKIVPTGEAKQSATVTADGPYGGERIMTHVVIVQHALAAQMVPLLRPLMAPTSQLSTYEPANALIVTDYADNIRRLLRIIDKIDQPVSTDVTIIPLQHASALDLAELIAQLAVPGLTQRGAAPAPGQPAAASAAERFSIVPDLRTNSLLIRTDNPGRLNQLQSLIRKLDVPATVGGNTRVIYLKNADATKLVEVLRGLLAAEARAQAPAAAGKAPAAKAVEASLIQADEATNSLIINASDAVYNNLRGVIDKLDVRRAQVYVEALIAEITTNKAAEFGFQWFAGGSAGDAAIGGVQNFPNVSSGRAGIVGTAIDPGTALATSQGLTLAYVGEKITLPDGTEIVGLGALARFLETNSETNVLSTPNLVTLDNAEAKIVVGQNVPFLTGSFAQPSGTGTTVNPFQTFERKDVGLQLKIKPQISEGGSIKLEIAQEVSSLAVAATALVGAQQGIVTNKRTLETKVVVDDGHTIVLGGLIEDTVQDSVQKVPLLGDIPLLGALFRYTEKQKAKTNLLVFLRPMIIRTPADGYGISANRYEHLRRVTPALDKEPTANLERFRPELREVPTESLPPREGLLGPPQVGESGESQLSR